MVLSANYFAAEMAPVEISENATTLGNANNADEEYMMDGDDDDYDDYYEGDGADAVDDDEREYDYFGDFASAAAAAAIAAHMPSTDSMQMKSDPHPAINGMHTF